MTVNALLGTSIAWYCAGAFELFELAVIARSSGLGPFPAIFGFTTRFW